jgi:hypothetical protein
VFIFLFVPLPPPFDNFLVSSPEISPKGILTFLVSSPDIIPKGILTPSLISGEIGFELRIKGVILKPGLLLSTYVDYLLLAT